MFFHYRAVIYTENPERAISDLLSGNTIFNGLTKQQIESVLPCVLYSIQEYSPEECVYDKGDEVEGLGIVVDGALMVCDDTKIASNIEKNGILGEALVFSSSGALEHRVIAGKGARIAFLSKDFFLEPCARECGSKDAHKEIISNMFRLLSDRTIFLSKKIAYLSAPDLKTKIAMYLCELYETTGSTTFTMPLNRDRLAEFFSVARPSLSRELISLKVQGIIDFHRSSVTLLDIPCLYSLARGE